MSAIGRTLIVAIMSCAVALGFSSQNAVPVPAGVITGRVVDDEGRPMRGAQVQALVLDYQNGRPRMRPRGNTANTNDRGEFRLFRLEPGNYFVAISPNPQPLRPTPQSSRQRLGYIPANPGETFVTTYFPGTADVRHAQAIRLGTEELNVHAIRAAALPSRAIRMRIQDPGLVEKGFYPVVTIQPLNGFRQAPWFQSVPQPLGNGELQLRTGLVPGPYRIHLEVLLPDASYAGGAAFTLGQTDPEVLQIAVSRTVSVQGQIVDAGNASSLEVLSLPHPGNNSGTPVWADVRTNGKFVLENIVPGTYEFSVEGLGSDEYVASVRLQGNEVSPASIVIPSGREPLMLTLNIRRDGGSIRGVVVDESRAARALAAIVLLPKAEFPTRFELFRFASTNAQGEFQISGIVPGNYKVLAFQQIDPDSFRNLDFLKRFDDIGVETAVAASARVNLGVVEILKP